MESGLDDLVGDLEIGYDVADVDVLKGVVQVSSSASLMTVKSLRHTNTS